MAEQYLSLTGLQEYHGKLKTAFAELDANGKVPSALLPSYVDDVIEAANKASFPTTGETGKIYVETSTNKTYRWSGSAYVEISASLAIGETSSTAYRGDRGKIAYEHSQSAHAPSNAEKNQNAFSNIKVGSTTVAADTTTDTVELVAGSNVTITPDATNDKITIAATDTNTTYDLAASASSANGNVKLNLTAGGSGSGTDSVTIQGSGATSVTTDANGVITISSTDNNTVYTHPTHTPYDLGLYKVTVDGLGHVTSATTVTKADITSLGIPAQDTTYTFNGAVSTIKDSNLTASRALISNSSGKVAVSDVTSTELGYLDGVTSNIQTQLNSKGTSNLTIGTTATTAAAGNHTHSGYASTTSVTNLQTEVDAKLAKSGGTLTGALTAQNNTSYTTKQVRNITLSTAEPTSSDGANGDIWIVYEA